MALAPIKATHTTANMTTSSGAVIAANTSRRYLFIQNNGSATVFLNLGATAVANEGIKLLADTAYEMSPEFNNLYRGAVNGITASGTATLMVTEGV